MGFSPGTWVLSLKCQWIFNFYQIICALYMLFGTFPGPPYMNKNLLFQILENLNESFESPCFGNLELTTFSFLKLLDPISYGPYGPPSDNFKFFWLFLCGHFLWIKPYSEFWVLFCENLKVNISPFACNPCSTNMLSQLFTSQHCMPRSVTLAGGSCGRLSRTCLHWSE